MNALLTVFRREFAAYFATPLATVVIIVFLAMVGIFTFYVGDFFGQGQADLNAFFTYHPWLYLFLVPAIAMRLWADERKSGTIELLLTLPMPLWAVVVGKFLAGWAFIAVALALTFPLWLTVTYLGEPDHGMIAAGYLGSLLMAGGYLAIGACLSAATRNQVIAFVTTAVVCFLFTVSGESIVLDSVSGWAPKALVDTIASFSFITHFTGLSGGLVEARDLVFFTSLIVTALTANAIVVELKKAG